MVLKNRPFKIFGQGQKTTNLPLVILKNALKWHLRGPVFFVKRYASTSGINWHGFCFYVKHSQGLSLCSRIPPDTWDEQNPRLSIVRFASKTIVVNFFLKIGWVTPRPLLEEWRYRIWFPFGGFYCMASSRIFNGFTTRFSFIVYTDLLDLRE